MIPLKLRTTGAGTEIGRGLLCSGLPEIILGVIAKDKVLGGVFISGEDPPVAATAGVPFDIQNWEADFVAQGTSVNESLGTVTINSPGIYLFLVSLGVMAGVGNTRVDVFLKVNGTRRSEGEATVVLFNPNTIERANFNALLPLFVGDSVSMEVESDKTTDITISSAQAFASRV